ncbi:hypothetical protein HJG60_008789 [Phyllostomus discolor]|uniref:Uncharacterized protein n=1 Tax=Phyllostomus discolor TaxID=89673 RepID=A0A833YZ10_9CHIR|nr:hypothetical protein HJG60_008789 [Phyllostomus discolor]
MSAKTCASSPSYVSQGCSRTRERSTRETEETDSKVSFVVRPFEMTASPKLSLPSQPASPPLSTVLCVGVGGYLPGACLRASHRSQGSAEHRSWRGALRLSDLPGTLGGVCHYPVCGPEIRGLVAGFWLLDVIHGHEHVTEKSRVCSSNYRQCSQ